LGNNDDWRNIYNPIWLSYNRRPSNEDLAARNLLVVGLIALVAWLIASMRPEQSPGQVQQNDIFKDW
jgi:hypothetical protein